MHISLQRQTIAGFRSVKKKLVLDYSKLPAGLYFVEGWNDQNPRLGSNGSGKSTVFSESFKWLLTGAISESQRPGDHVKNRQSDKTEVSARFEFNDTVRELGRFRGPNNLTIDGNKVEQLEIDGLFPLSDEAMSRSIFISQFADLFLTMGPEQKSRMFSETLDLDKWITAAEKASKEISRIEKLIAEAERQLAHVVGSKETAEKALVMAEDAEKVFVRDRKARLVQARSDLSTILEQRDQAELALNKARAANTGEGAAKTEANDLKSVLRQRRDLLAQADKQLIVARTEEVKLKRELAKYSEADGVCPECGQHVSDEHLENKVKNLKRSSRIATDEMNNRDQAVKELTKNVDWLEDRIEELEESLADFNKGLADVAVAAERSQNLLKQYHTAQAKVQSIKDEINPHTAQCDKLEEELNQYDAREKQYLENVETNKTSLEIYEFWQKGFKQIRLEQIDNTLVELEVATNKHAAELGLEDERIEFATERATKSGKMSHSFSVMLYTADSPDESVPFEVYCGGEKQRWQLAVTFGLSEVLLDRAGVSTDFEIIDEPTTHLSDEGIDDLLECLKTRAVNTGRRIFLIDHRVLNKGAFDAVVTVLKDKTGTSVKCDLPGFVVKERSRL